MEGAGNWVKASILTNFAAILLCVAGIVCFCTHYLIAGSILGGLGIASVIAAYVLEAIARHKGEWVP